MNSRQLGYLVAVAREGSISRAAVSLGVAQPSISRRLAELEEEAGVPILLRHGRGVQLTEAGTRLLAHAEAVVREITEAERELAASRSAPGGTASIGMTHAMAAALGPRVVAAFRARYPDVMVRIMEGFGIYLREQLMRGSIHAALMYDPQRSKDFRFELVGRQDMFLVGPPGHPIFRDPIVPFADLSGLTFTLPRQDLQLRQLLERFTRKLGKNLSVAVEAESASTMRAMVLAHGLFTVLPYLTVRDDVAAGVLGASRIVEPGMESPIALVTAPWLPLGAPARHLISTARKELTALLREAEADNGGARRSPHAPPRPPGQ